MTGVLAGGPAAGGVPSASSGVDRAAKELGRAVTVPNVASAVGAAVHGEFQAGERGSVEAPLPAGVATARVDAAARTGAILGLPGATRRSATRVVDRFAGRTYDEVMEYDARDRLVSLQRFDSDGRILAAVRFGWRGDGGPALAGTSAVRLRAERLANSLGLAPSGLPRITTPSDAGWTVAWDRAVDGIPVPGDGLRIQLWADGSVHGLSRSERPLAVRPATTIDASRAWAVVEAQLGAWFPGALRADVAVGSAALAWVPPNDTFAPAGPDAPASVLRLAWVVRATTSGSLADTIRAVEVYVDAGSGVVIGGDVLE